MILETLAWTTLFYTASFTIPCIIPRLRSHYKPAVFDNHNSVIDDDEQNAIDQTIGQLVATGAQMLMVAGAVVDLFTPLPLHSLVIGFYAYDMIHLYMHPYGKALQMYLIHHAVTIALIGYLYLIETPYTKEIDAYYILLEVSSVPINAVNLIKFFYPLSDSLDTLQLANVVVYGITRVVLYPLNLGWSLYCVLTSDNMWIHVPPFLVLVLLYGVCVQWFLAMGRKLPICKARVDRRWRTAGYRPEWANGSSADWRDGPLRRLPAYCMRQLTPP